MKDVDRSLITSDTCVSLFVCLLKALLKKLLINFNDILWNGMVGHNPGTS